MAKDGYTTIRIRESSRQKLEKLGEGTGLTMSDILEIVERRIFSAIENNITGLDIGKVVLQPKQKTVNIPLRIKYCTKQCHC